MCLFQESLMQINFAFEFKRVQFPVSLTFAMSINKSQGQSLEVCGINFELLCFSHGQLYVACSRVGKPLVVFVFSPYGKTKNIVHSKAFQSIKFLYFNCNFSKQKIMSHFFIRYTTHVKPSWAVSIYIYIYI